MFKQITNTAKEEIEVNTALIITIYKNQITFTGGMTLDLTDESMKIIRETVLPKERKKKTDEPKSELNDLFDKLHKLVGGRGKAVFTLGREKKLNELLTKHRMTEDNLIDAATNIGQDNWLQGENENKKRYGDIDYLLRPDKAAKYAEEQGKKKKGMF